MAKNEIKPIIGTSVYKGQLSLQTWTNFILKDCASDKWSKAIGLRDRKWDFYFKKKSIDCLPIYNYRLENNVDSR